MLLSKKLTDMLNEQINHEQTNEFKYKSIQSYFEDKNLNGFAKYFREQADHEHGHREKIIQYLSDKNAHIQINISSYKHIEFNSVPDILKMVNGTQDVSAGYKAIPDILNLYYEVEIDTTKRLYSICKQAQDEIDYGTVSWLYSYLIPEQVEEEKSVLNLKAEVLDGWGDSEQLNGIHLRNIDRRLMR